MAGTIQEVATLKSDFKLQGIGKAIKDLRAFNTELKKVKEGFLVKQVRTPKQQSQASADKKAAREQLKDLKSQNKELKKQQQLEERLAKSRKNKVERTMGRASNRNILEGSATHTSLQRLNQQFLAGKKSAIEYDTAVNRIIGSHARLNKSSDSTYQKMHKLRTGFIALTAAATPFAAGAAVTETGRQIENLGLAFEVAFGDRASEKMKEFKSIVADTGVNLKSTMRGYKLFAVATKESGFDDAAASGIFRTISKASVVYGSSMEETEGVLRAITQMINKGTVMAKVFWSLS